MNIQQAKNEIKHTLLAYTRCSNDGQPLFPIARQRPILLMGPPGIGKTAILEQIAQEAGIGLVSYAMTHHTRQSAIGLPQLQSRVYHGQGYTVTEYTMSEIVAAVYDCMARTGKSRGILFLDEINCVSETLAPAMLQLLQNKTFGSHRLPDGWILVAAGNPPAYNKSVREFDMATLDRVRVIPVEANLPVWLDYAAEHHVHSAILSWLTIRPEHFYRVDDTPDGKFFVTARGWEDLSELLRHYEALSIPVDKALIRQYLQQDEIASAFAVYYDLYQKYRQEYAISQLLDGQCSGISYNDQVAMARNGSFDERLTVTQLLLDKLDSGFLRYGQQYRLVSQLHEALEQLNRLGGTLEAAIQQRRNALEVKTAADLLTPEAQALERAVLDELEQYAAAAKAARRSDFDFLRQRFAARTQALEQQAQQLLKQLENGFRFAEDAFGDGQELTLLVSRLSRSTATMEFISAYGCDGFLRHGDILLYRQQEQRLQAQCQQLTDARIL